jgi:hypothetical protein
VIGGEIIVPEVVGDLPGTPWGQSTSRPCRVCTGHVQLVGSPSTGLLVQGSSPVAFEVDILQVFLPDSRTVDLIPPPGSPDLESE